jgi:hypothetical protein
MQESFLKAGGLKELDFPLPFFFLGNGSTLRQTGGNLEPLVGEMDRRLLTECESSFATVSSGTFT